jgi:hypothetical protein
MKNIKEMLIKVFHKTLFLLPLATFIFAPEIILCANQTDCDSVRFWLMSIVMVVMTYCCIRYGYSKNYRETIQKYLKYKAQQRALPKRERDGYGESVLLKFFKAAKLAWMVMKKIVLLSLLTLIIFALILSWRIFSPIVLPKSAKEKQSDIMRQRFYDKIDQTISDGKNSFLLKDANLDFGSDFKWDRVCYVSEDGFTITKFNSIDDEGIIRFLNIKNPREELLWAYDSSYTGMVFSDGNNVKSFYAIPHASSKKNTKNNSFYPRNCCDNKIVVGVEKLNKPNNKISLSWSLICN